MKYNIALTFNNEINQKIYDLHNKIKNDFNSFFEVTENSIFHSTIIKFESEKKMTGEDIKNLLQDIDDFQIELAGLTILPSHSEGYWLEISLLKSSFLFDIQKKLISKLEKVKILNATGDRFRPHITLAKIKNGQINLKNLDNSFLRQAKIKAKMTIGLADGPFELKNI